jgi:hypothetical protein
MTAESIQALSVLRSTANLQWYIVPLLATVFYIYFVEVERKNWSLIVMGLTFWAAEFTWEIGNALLLYITNYAPLWLTPGKSAYVIYAGLNIEISFFFAIYGLMALKILPQDKNLKIMGISNRLVIPTILGLCGLFVEIILNQCNMLIWTYSFWRWPNLWLLAIGYCAPLLILTWLYDNLSMKAKKIALVFTVSVAIVCHVVFAVVLKWI